MLEENHMTTGADVVAKAMTQKGKPYIFGYEVNLDDPNPKAFDCSEFIQWISHQLKTKPEMPDGAANQKEFCRKQKTMVDMHKAVNTPGALLFRISEESGNHVVIVKSKTQTIEARGKAYGVGCFPINGRTWTHAALIPGVTYG